MPPFNLTLVCVNPFFITLTWIADFNGGDKQTFHVLSSSGENNSSFKELTTVGDKGFGQIHSYSPAVEMYGQLWFRIAASNKFGNSTTSAIPCFTKGKCYIYPNVSFGEASIKIYQEELIPFSLKVCFYIYPNIVCRSL